VDTHTQDGEELAWLRTTDIVEVHEHSSWHDNWQHGLKPLLHSNVRDQSRSEIIKNEVQSKYAGNSPLDEPIGKSTQLGDMFV